MSQRPTRFIIPTGANLNSDYDVFPSFGGLNFISKKKPFWATSVMTARSGRERRLQTWSYPKWSIELSLDFIRNPPTDSDLQKLYAFFNNHAGSYQEFLWMDSEDKEYVNTTFGIGDGSSKTFRLLRPRSVGAHTYYEPVMAFYGDPVVRINGVVQSPGVYTVANYGYIVFDTAPANGAVLSSSGTFFYVCRFEEDELDTEQMMSRLWKSGSIELVSVKP